jgi:ferritin-like protein
MTEYHEPWEALSEEARNFHRALKSLQEELEAVDWYHQRWSLSADESLRAVLAHNRDEEIEHACMTLEWLRRNMPVWDRMLRTYLFTQAPITEVEEAAEEQGPGAGPGIAPRRSSPGPPSIGSLRSLPREP